MLIANPIYDVSFKRLLENDSTAKFVIGTILGCKVISLQATNTEYPDESEEDASKLTLFRMDFTATIVTQEEGERRVIIEMQKARHLADVFRFKRYLGKEYRRAKLPIISIYILGFNLSVESEAFVAAPECLDLKTGEKLNVRDHFVEQLTHRAYFVQANRITPSLNTKLEMLLSIFEQANFMDESTATKKYLIETDDPEINEVLKVLQYIAANAKTREELDREEENALLLDGIFGEQNKKIEKQKEMLEQQAEALSQKDEENRRQAEENKRQAEENRRQIEENRRQAEENRKLAEENEQLKKLLEGKK